MKKPRNMNRFIDLIYCIVFPAGYRTIFISVYLFIAIFALFLIHKIIRNKQEPNDSTQLNFKWQIFLFIFLTGLFFPILMAFYMTVMFFMTFSKLSKSIKNSSAFKKILKIIFLILMGLVYFLLNVYWVLELFWYSKTRGLVMFVGLILGILFFIEKKFKGKGMNLVVKAGSTEISAKTLNKICAIALIIPVVSSGLFFPVIFIKNHTVPTSNATGTLSIDIMTYNLRNAGSIEKNSEDFWSKRKAYLTDYIESFDLDIFGVQEAYLKQLNFIQKNLQNRNYKYAGVGRDEGTFGGEIEAIFYDTAKFDYIDGDTFWLSDTPQIPSKNWDKSNYRSCTWVRFEDKSTHIQFFVFNTHFSTKNCTAVPCVQQKSAALINEKIAQLTKDLPTILMGDFNMENTSLAFSYLEEYGDKPLHDSLKEFNNGTVPFDYTTNEFRPLSPELEKKRIDYIFLSSSIVAENVQIPKDTYRNDRTYSDHYPVLATITIG
ncbi:MAG: endonuclease/exonuclease/phosphatase family protein [Promethearchaeota archaeon]